MEENLNNNQEPKMQETNKQGVNSKTKKKKAKIAVIILSTIIVLLLGLQIYAATNGYGNVFFMIRDWTTTKNATGEEVFVDEEKEIEEASVKELDVNSSLVRKLYKYILKENSEVESLAYQSKKVTVNDLQNDTKLCTLLVNLEDSEADETKKVQGVVKELTQYIYNTNTIKNKTKEIFGNDINIQYKNVDDLVSRNDYVYENGKYIKSEIQQGGGNYPAQTLEYVLKAEQDGDTINIYDKFVYIYVNLGRGYNTCIYKDSSRKAKILDNVSDKQLYDEFLMQTYSRDEQYNKNVIKKIEAASGIEAPTYKHTFKKAEDGSYYWYSTEPLEEIKETSNTTINSINKNEQLEPDNYAEEVMKDEQKQNTQLEPDNYAEEVAKDEIKQKVLECIAEKQKNGENEKLIDYKVEEVEIVGDEDKNNLINQYPSEYKKNDYLAHVYYSVKPQDINNSSWLAGSGITDGEWIKNKYTCVVLREGKILGFGSTSF